MRVVMKAHALRKPGCALPQEIDDGRLCLIHGDFLTLQTQDVLQAMQVSDGATAVRSCSAALALGFFASKRPAD